MPTTRRIAAVIQVPRTPGETPPPPSTEPVAQWNLAGDGSNSIAGSPAMALSAPEIVTAGGLVASLSQCMAFNGSSAKGVVPTSPIFALEDYTIIEYVQVISLPPAGQWRTISSRDSPDKSGTPAIRPPGGMDMAVINVGGVGKIRGYGRDINGSAVYLGGDANDGVGSLVVGTATRLAWVKSGGTISLYQDDGVAVASITGQVGWTNLGEPLCKACYNTNTSFSNVILQKSMVFDRALNQTEIEALEPAQNVPYSPPAGQGIFIPELAPQQLRAADGYSVPAGAIWLDPTNGNDGNNGLTKGSAKKTFSAAQSAMGTGGTIVGVGGNHAMPTITLSQSGGTRTFMAEPDAAPFVALIEDDFQGAYDQSWTWELEDSSLQIWRGPNIGGLPETTVTQSSDGRTGNVSNGLWGLIEIPGGPFGNHFQRLMWYDNRSGGSAWTNNAFEKSTSSNRRITSGGWGGPGLHCSGDGRVRIRMQPQGSAYQGSRWPTDGRMGTVCNTTGQWVGPGDGADPNDFKIHITRFTDNFGVGGTKHIDTNGQDNWRFLGINGALCQQGWYIDSSSGIEFERCTVFPQGTGVEYRGNSPAPQFRRCQVLSGDNRMIAWREHKNSGNYWYQKGRNVWQRSSNQQANTGANALWEDSVAFGFFDWMLESQATDGVFQHRYCALLCNIDDGFSQMSTNADWAVDAYRCYQAGGPPWSSGGNQAELSRDHHWRFCVMDMGFPMLWAPEGDPIDSGRDGVRPQRFFPTHNAGTTGSIHIRKMWNCTLIGLPDTTTNANIIQESSPAGHDVASGRAHECYNNIYVVRDNKRYASGSQRRDHVAYRLVCNESQGGTHRHDYDCFWRDVPSPQSNLFFEIQNSRNNNQQSYASLSAFRNSSQYTASASMYSDGTAGHEEHGVEVDPGFVDATLSARDYRPTNSAVTTGHKDVGGTGWPDATDTHSWKGACDPNGTGNDVGPRP